MPSPECADVGTSEIYSLGLGFSWKRLTFKPWWSRKDRPYTTEVGTCALQDSVMFSLCECAP